MSSLWGISPTMAEIHGLLYITGAACRWTTSWPASAISRGNVSMNLSKLVEWGLVRPGPPARRPTRLLRIAGRRMGDVHAGGGPAQAARDRPILATLRDCKEQLSPETIGAAAEDDKVQEQRRRVQDLLSLLSLMDSLSQRFFDSHRGLRAAVELLSETEA